MNRRTFIKAMASLPVVGGLVALKPTGDDYPGVDYQWKNPPPMPCQTVIDISCSDVGKSDYCGRWYRDAEDDMFARGMRLQCKCKGWKVLREERKDLGKGIQVVDGKRWPIYGTKITLEVEQDGQANIDKG